jgi:competence protein ComEC
MYILSIGFLVGTMSIHFLSTLPALNSLLFFSIFMPFIWILRRYHTAQWLFIVLLGYAYSLFIAHSILDNRIPHNIESKTLRVIGTVLDIPHRQSDTLRFYFNVEQSVLSDNPLHQLPFQGKIKLAWYRHAAPQFASGEKWQLEVKLKRPRGFVNTGGFDYERWLFREGVLATGYVHTSEHNQRITTAPQWHLNAIREKIYRSIQAQLNNPDSAALISALSVAIRQDINPAHWQIFSATGTSHLIAISGLHIAMVAGFAFIPISLIWMLFPALYLRLPSKIAMLVLGAVFATAYALLAGFTIPTQRALVMVLFGLFALLLKQKIPLGHILAASLLAVLLIDPLASLSEGFWLSFFAVALIFYILGQTHKPLPHRLFVIQLLLSFGMIPVSAAFFSSASLISPIANIVAIPWVTLLLAPSILVGVLFLSIAPIISHYCFAVAAWGLDILLAYLGYLSTLPYSSLHFADIPPFIIIIALIGVILMALPRYFVGRYLAIIFIAPLFLFSSKRPAEGEFKLTVLDSGQGLASVLQTQNHVMVFDTGERYSAQFDIGKMVLIPYLQSQQINAIDKLVVSHADKDHSGGAAAILATVPVIQFISNDALKINTKTAMPCQAGQQWVWDKVHFEILSPSPAQAALSQNERSCTIKVSNAYHSLLLLADIEKKAEHALVKNKRMDLKADVMLVPHHGSKTSSSWPFIAAIEPQLAIVSAGYRNRFNHPSPNIMSRYQQLHIPVFNTAQQGEIQVTFPNSPAEINVSLKRSDHKKFWDQTR